MLGKQGFLGHRARLQTLLRAHGASHVVAASSDSIFYVCGTSFEALARPFFLIVLRRGVPRLVVPFLERDHLNQAEAVDHGNI